MSRIRIVGGQWRSRLIEVPEREGLRPTPDRVRETVFNWLGQRLEGWHCLDVFAGSGAMGFEAASRGAARVTMVERDGRAVAALEQARHKLGASTVEIVRQDALNFRVSPLGRYDLAFVDPPYGQQWLPRLASCLDDWLKPDAWLYVEAEQAVPALGAWQAVRSGRAGQVHYQLMQRSA